MQKTFLECVSRAGELPAELSWHVTVSSQTGAVKSAIRLSYPGICLLPTVGT